MKICGEDKGLISDLLAAAFLTYMKIEHSLGKTKFGSVLGLVLWPVSAILKPKQKSQGLSSPVVTEEKKQ